MVPPCRWAVKIDAWNPEQEEWSYLLDLVSSEVQAEVHRYKFPADQRRALVSRLLQRRCSAEVCSLSFSEIDIQRTKGAKPFCASPCNRTVAPNFNFNVSHEGDYVVLAAEPVCICGIDVAAPPHTRSTKAQTANELFCAFHQQFTTSEWVSIKDAGDEAEQMQAFQKHWSLKEAFVKARGDGLGFALRDVEFELSKAHTNGVQTAAAKVDGRLLSRWRFCVQQLGEQHVVSVALGPPEDVIDAWGAFKNTFHKPDVSSAETQAALQPSQTVFLVLCISDIILPEARDGYISAGGDVMS